MPGLDPRTLAFVSAVAALCLWGVLVGVGSARRMARGFGAWRTSQLLIGVGSILVAARGLVPNWASIVVANVLLLVGMRLVTEGFSRFYVLKRWVPLWVDVAVILATGVALAAWSEGPANRRVALAGAASAFFLARTGLEPLGNGEARRSFAQRLVITLNLTSATFLLLRSAWALWAPPYAGLLREGWTVLIPGVLFTAVNLTSMNVALYLTYARSERDLRGALEKAKQLAGLLPICSHCHKIRNDQGYWQKLERYISDHSEAQFTHGICPECLKEWYPEKDELGG